MTRLAVRHAQQARQLRAAFKQLRNTYWAGLLEFLVGQVDRTEGKLDAAEERFRAGLASFRQLDNLMGVAWALYTFGDLAVARGQYERALRLVGASEALLEQLGVGQMPALATATMGDVGAAARTFLDDDAAGRAYHEGSRMTLDAALAYTLRQEEHAVPERSWPAAIGAVTGEPSATKQPATDTSPRTGGQLS